MSASTTQSLRGGLIVSTIVHVSLAGALIAWGVQHEAPRPPVYRVEMIGAPKGIRQAGVVAPPAPEAPTTAEAPAGADRAPTEKAIASKKAPVAATPKATPSTVRSKKAGAKDTKPAAKASAAPKAASRDGGKGADVTNIDMKGIDFPFPGYLRNIVRQITLAYAPDRVSATLVSEVKFMIRRDGSVSGIEVVKSSGNRLFDLEAKSTIESIRNFGVLPTGWADDVLVVYFTFDYSLRPS